MSQDVYFTKSITRDNEGSFIMIKLSIYKKDKSKKACPSIGTAKKMKKKIDTTKSSIHSWGFLEECRNFE